MIDNSSEHTTTSESFFIVGIGASARESNALEDLLDNLAAGSGAAYVVMVQHLTPNSKNWIQELLERKIQMPVYQVGQGTELQPNSVYLISPKQNLTLGKNTLHLKTNQENSNQKLEQDSALDWFFTSLAQNYGERSIGVILSGTDSNGICGLEAINAAGGLALVQDSLPGKFKSLAENAIATGTVDSNLSHQDLSRLIYQYILASTTIIDAESRDSHLIDDDILKKIIQILLDKEKLDFSPYKSKTIFRRIYRRFLLSDVASIDAYVNLINNSSDERELLGRDLLIKVTRFFRNHQAWQNLERSVLPQLIEQSQPDGELRFWVAACSTGEDVYSLAILIREALRHTSKDLRVKIFATDIEPSVLKQASAGIYPSSIATEIKDEYLHKYFVTKGNLYQIVPEIRKMIIFSDHDLTKNIGFTRINLIICRNFLIYIKPELQDLIIRNFHFSLASKGVLFLGKAETLGKLKSEFVTLDQKWKLYQKRRDSRLSSPLYSVRRPNRNKASRHYSERQNQPKKFTSILEQSLERLSNESNSVILLIDSSNHLLYVSGNSSKILKTPEGVATTEVTKMVFEPLQIPLITALYRARKQGKAVLCEGIKIVREEETLDLSLEVIPPQVKGKFYRRENGLSAQHKDFFLVKIKPMPAMEVSAPKEILPAENLRVNYEASLHIMELEEELKQTRESLQALVEQLESTNEEQQASNEELIAANEELRQTNEKLNFVNVKYQSQIGELTQLSDDLNNLLQSTEIGVVFLDAELKIRKFTPAISTAIALRNSDLNRPLKELNWKFECPHLLELLNEVLITKRSQELEVELKRSPGYLLMQIHPYQSENQARDGLVLNFIHIDEIKLVQKKLEQEIEAHKSSQEQLKINQQQLLIAQEQVKSIFSSIEDAVWSFELPQKQLCYLNDSFEQIYGRSKDEFWNNPNLWLQVIHPEDRELVEVAHQMISQQQKLDIEYRILRPDGSIRWLRDRSKIILDDLGTAIRQDFVISDLTVQREAQLALRERERSYQAIFNSMYQFIGVLTPQGILLEANQTALVFGGLAKEDVINRPFWEAKWWTISPATQEQLKKAIARAAKGEFVRYEVDVLGADDQIVTIDFSLKPVIDVMGQVVQIIHEGRDISEIKKAREELRHSNLILEQRVTQRTKSLQQFSDRLQRLHRLAISQHANLQDFWADYLQTGCRMLNLSTGIISEVNDCIYKIVAVESPLDLEVGNESPCVDTYCAEVVETQTTITFTQVGKVESMQNHPVYLNLKLESFIGTPIFVSGSLYGTLNFSDTNPRKSEFTPEEIKIVELMARDIGNSISSARSEEALRKSEVKRRLKVEQADKLELANQAKDNFIAHISHELRTPLNSVIGFSELLNKDSSLTEKQLKFINLINQSGQHLLTLINNVLDLSKLNADKLEIKYSDLNLVDFLHNVATIFEIRAQDKGLNFLMDLSKEIPTITNVDETKLRQVLFNLLSNAVKFTSNGSITLSVSCLAVASNSDLKTVRFEVEDTGKGIPKNEYGTIFTPFGQLEQNDRDTEGTGLGLPISQKILNLMDSKLYLDSTVGEGSRFWFDLDLPEIPGFILDLDVEDVDSNIDPIEPETNNSNVKLILPSEETLKELLELVSCGKIKELSSQINLLAKEKHQYISFIKQSKSLLDDLQLEKLEKMLESLIKT